MSMEHLVGRSLGAGGKYRLMRLLGRGGMGAVYEAEEADALQRRVALKVLDPRLTAQPGFVERFRQEARTIANLEHPHIVPVYAFGEDDGLLYLVMRLITGGTLKERFEQFDGPLAPRMVVTWATQVLSALDYAHDQGIIHRDIKPGNILMQGEWAILSDFGIAKRIREDLGLTQAGTTVGTPDYMSPEQVMGMSLDGRSDLYAFGVVLYQALTGRIPFPADTPWGAALLHIQAPLPDPRSFNPALSDAVAEVLIRALAKDREDRYPSGEALAAALRAAVDEPTAARRAALDSASSQETIVGPHRTTDQIGAPPPAPADTQRSAPLPTPPKPSDQGPALPPRQAPSEPIAVPPPPTAAEAGDTLARIAPPVAGPSDDPSGRAAERRPITAPEQRPAVAATSPRTVPAAASSGGLPFPILAVGGVAALLVVGVIALFLLTSSGPAATPTPTASVATPPGALANPSPTLAQTVSAVQPPTAEVAPSSVTTAVPPTPSVASVATRAWTVVAGGPDGAVQLQRPAGVAVDIEGNLYVTEFEGFAVRKLSPSGEPLARWGEYGNGPGEFNNPHGISMDARGNVDVADWWLGRLQWFSPDGEPGGTRLGSAEIFNRPRDLAVAADGSIYIANTGDHQLLKFSASQESVWRRGGRGGGATQFEFPYGLALDAQGTVYVADWGNHRIQKLSPEGEWIGHWGSRGNAPGQFDGPYGVAIDAQGNVYVSDSGNNRIQMLSPDGEPLAQWGGPGSEPGQFNLPAGLIVDLHGNLYVADMNNNRIQKLSPPEA